VLVCDELKVSRSLAKSIRNRGYDVRVDTDFAGVLRGCAAPRRDGAGTWLGAAMRSAYLRLHRAGWAHSFECWRDGELLGGLYGVAMGRMFFGESMFARAADASKVALVALVRVLQARRCPLIDCQVRTPLLASLGAREIPRAEFMRRLRRLVHYAAPTESWSHVPAE